MTYDRQILRILSDVGEQGISVQLLAKHVYNQNLSLFFTPNMEEIRSYVVKEFRYDLSRTCDEIRPTYHHVESCQETVPEAVTAFLEGENFVDVIRTAVSLGGDCDTLTCIAGSIAEAYYGVPAELKEECSKRLPGEMLAVLSQFDALRAAGFEGGAVLNV